MSNSFKGEDVARMDRGSEIVDPPWCWLDGITYEELLELYQEACFRRLKDAIGPFLKGEDTGNVTFRAANSEEAADIIARLNS